MHNEFFGHKVLYITALACALIELDKNNVKSGYPQIVKDFSQQVRFYSTAAYEVVRKHFVLPSSATHQRWTQPVDVSPGFTTFSLMSLKVCTNNFWTQAELLSVNFKRDQI